MVRRTRIRSCLGVLPLLIVACGSGGTDLPDGNLPTDSGPIDRAPVPEDPSMPPDSGKDDPSPMGDGEVVPPGPDVSPSDVPVDPGPPRGPCESAGGLCVVGRQECQEAGGTVHPEGDSQCLFDDGPLFCCTPPSPMPAGADCRSRGGLCVTTPGVCHRTGGIHAPPTDDCPPGPGSMCCLPADRCPPGDDLECCMGSWTAVPYCDRGTWTCLGGGTPVPAGSCLSED